MENEPGEKGVPCTRTERGRFYARVSRDKKMGKKYPLVTHAALKTKNRGIKEKGRKGSRNERVWELGNRDRNGPI